MLLLLRFYFLSMGLRDRYNHIPIPCLTVGPLPIANDNGKQCATLGITLAKQIMFLGKKVDNTWLAKAEEDTQ